MDFKRVGEFIKSGYSRCMTRADKTHILWSQADPTDIFFNSWDDHFVAIISLKLNGY